MKLTTIWTLKGMPLRERFNRTGELMLIKLAHHLPRKLAYRSFIDTGVRYMGNDVVPDVRYMTILERFGHDSK